MMYDYFLRIIYATQYVIFAFQGMREREGQMDMLATLTNSPLFERLNEEVLSELAENCSVISRLAGEVLLKEGEFLSQFYILGSGQARSYLLNPDGKRFIVNTYLPNQCLGLEACLGKWRYQSTLEIVEDASLIVISLEKAELLSRTNMEFCQNILHYTLRKTQRLHDIIRDLNFGALTRLSRHLFRTALEKSIRSEGGISFRLQKRKSELAEELGITPETLSRMFSQLQNKGVISVEGQTITVFSMHDLVLLSESLL